MISKTGRHVFPLSLSLSRDEDTRTDQSRLKQAAFELYSPLSLDFPDIQDEIFDYICRNFVSSSHEILYRNDYGEVNRTSASLERRR